ncbi:MAG: hypothetical protein E7678_04665 [Ruminococcaceae bacterium]|nr:hypothetical protein [Oscillospiraceae bacterium]
MKKICAFAVILAMLITIFSGCVETKLSDNQISKLLNDAFSKVDSLQSVDAKNYSEVSYDFGSYAYTVTTEASIREANIGNKDKYEMSTDVVVESFGSETSYETYYKDGYYYTSRYGGNFKTKMDLEDAQTKSSVSLVRVAFDDMKTVATQTLESTSSEAEVDQINEDSSDNGESEKLTYISFSCKNKVLKEYMQKSLSDTNGDIESATITDSDGQYIINEDGYLVSERLSVSAKINVNGEETTSVISVKTVFNNVGEDVNPYDPEDSEYTAVKDMENVINLYGSMSGVFTSDYLDMDMNVTTDIDQDGNLSGYKRTYQRKLSTDKENFSQEVETSYLEGEDYGKNYVSGQYYTDGTYYSNSDMTGIKLECDLEFKDFYTTIYASTAKTPASLYVTGMMKDIKAQKTKEDTVYSFGLNPKTAEGVDFLQSLFGPYEQFGGDCEAAETIINKFVGKSYVNKDGQYYKTVMECDLLIKFEEGDVKVKCQQTVEVNSTKKNEIKFSFPKFKGYEKWDKADLLSAYS